MDAAMNRRGNAHGCHRDAVDRSVALSYLGRRVGVTAAVIGTFISPLVGPLVGTFISAIGLSALSFPMSAAAHEAVGPVACQPLPEVQAWLDLHIVRWDAVLAAEPGYERPSSVTVCAVPAGRPFADNRANRVFVRGVRTVDEQITVAHEYIHIAFQHYPSGHNEGYVEHTARRLIAESP